MLDINKIIVQLIRNAKPFQEIQSFSDKPGIYAFFFYGEKFPLPGYTPRKGQIIYIGKTESSQQKRDADTHFATGKTGSSTVRKSFGALLREELGLKPVPRGQADIDAGRTSAFKFDDDSEEKLTEWMVSNLGLSYYEYDVDAKKIDMLETALIRQVVPVINIDKNPDNPYLLDLKRARKEAAEEAYKNVAKGTKIRKAKSSSQPRQFNMANIYKYEDIWRVLLPDIRESVENGTQTEIQLQKRYFDEVGNRNSYSFNLEFKNGKVANNIGGSAVARDLARVMQNDTDMKALLKGKHVKIRIDKEFMVFIKLI